MALPPSAPESPSGAPIDAVRPARRRHAFRHSPARIIIVAVIVIVALGAAAFVVIRVDRHNAAVAKQRQALATADRNLAATFAGYASRTNACARVANPYRCIERADVAMVPPLAAYVEALDRAGNTGLGRPVIDGARTSAQQAAQAFQKVGHAAPTKEGYTRSVTRSDVVGIVATLQDSVNAVIRQLNPPAGPSSG